MKNRKLRMGMIGGGSDAFIGAIHRRAALMENEIELVCGCFSVKPEISISSGRSYYVPDNRIYTTWEEMLEKEAALPEDERMDFVRRLRCPRMSVWTSSPSLPRTVSTTGPQCVLWSWVSTWL